MQLIDRSAVTCRIREESQSDEEYEKLNPNEGQPLNVWRVDMEVANYSGRLLDHLLVFLDVESKWPPCTSWDGPERSYGKVHKFAGSMMRLQRTGKLTGLPPGEVARETEILLVWHREEPTLGRWTIDYDFADPPRTGEPQTPPETAPEAPRIERPATGLPPSVRAEKTCERKGESCWTAVANKPGCYLWLDNERSTERMVTWTGECSSGLAQGFGELRLSYINGEGNPEVLFQSWNLRAGKRKAVGHYVVPTAARRKART